MIKLFKS